MVSLGKTASRLLTTYYRGPDHFCKRRLWNAGFRLLGYPVIQAQLGTAWINLDIRDLLQFTILTTGGHEPEVWKSLAAFAGSDEVIWDIGGHIGSFALMAAQDPRIKQVHCFEPHPRTYESLLANLSLNDLPIVPHRFGFAQQTGWFPLSDGDPGNTGSAQLQRAPERGISVLCRTVDEVLSEDGLAPPTLIKIDVEGAELQCLNGARRLFEKSPPKAIVFEGNANERAELLDKDVATFFQGYGYRVRHIPREAGFVGHKENYLAWRQG